MNITLLVIVLVVYFAAMVGIGFMGRKHAESFDSFVCNRSENVLKNDRLDLGHVIKANTHPLTTDAGMLVASKCHGLGYLAIALVLNKRVYTKGYISLPEFLEEHYGDKLTSAVFSVATVLSYIGNIAAQIMAGSALFRSFGLNGTLGAVAITVVVLAYSSLSGLWGAYATSVVQVGVIAVAMIAAGAGEPDRCT